jgi:hypothetical protein
MLLAFFLPLPRVLVRIAKHIRDPEIAMQYAAGIAAVALLH